MTSVVGPTPDVVGFVDVTEPHTLETFKAAVDALFPGGEGRPGAVELRAHQHVIELVELGLPQGFAELIAGLLDIYAETESPSRSFVELSADQRMAVLRAMSGDPNPDTADAAGIFWILALGAMYSEWTGFDPGTRQLGDPAMWSSVGYPGPVVAHPDYREQV